MGVATCMAKGGAWSWRSRYQQVLLGFSTLLWQFSTAGINKPVRNLYVMLVECMKLVEGLHTWFMFRPVI